MAIYPLNKNATVWINFFLRTSFITTILFLVLHSLINHASYAKAPQRTISLTTAEQQWIKQHPQVILGVGLHWAPFDFIDKTGKHSGITNDYLTLISQKTGLNFQLSINQWSNNLKKIQDQEIDLLGAANYTKERSNFAYFSKPYIEVLDYFFIRDDLSVKTLDDLNGKRVAIPYKYAQAKVLKKHFPKIKLISVANFSDAVDAVLENKADALFDTYATISYALKQEGINVIVPFKSVRHLGTNPIYIMSRKGAPELASIIQKGLDAITQKERDLIYNRWIGTPSKIERSIKLTTSEKEWLKIHPTVSVGGTPDWAPFNFTNKNNEYTGIAHDYLQLIAKKTGLSLDIHIAPWNINLQKAKAKEIDLLGAVYFTKERNNYLNFSKPYFEVLDFFFIRDDVKATTLEDLNGKRVAIPREYAHIQFLQEHFPKIEIIQVNTFNDAINAVLENKADLLYDTYGSLTYTFSKMGINTIIPFKSTSYLGKKYIHIVSHKESPELASIIQKGLDSISENEKRIISDRWLGQRSKDKTLAPQLALSNTEKQRMMNKWQNDGINTTEVKTAINDSQEKNKFWLLTIAAVIFILLGGLFIIAKRIPDKVLVKRFGTERSQLTIVLILLLFTIFVSVTIHYMLQQNKREVVSQTHHNLSITLQGVVQQMNRWVDDRLDFLQQLGEHPDLIRVSKNLLKISTQPNLLKLSPELAQARQFFTHKEKFFGKSGFFIISPEMINIGSGRDSNIGQVNLIAEQRPDLLNKAFAGEAVFIPLIVSDLDRNDPLTALSCGRQCMSMFFAAPIRNVYNKVIAVVTQRVLPDDDWSQMLRFGRIGDSGESYVFNDNGLLASESRFRDHLKKAGLLLPEQNEVGTIEVRDPGGNILKGFKSSSSTKKPLTKMAQKLINFKHKNTNDQYHSNLHSEINAYNDYRGVPVFGAGLWNYRSGIGIITEINVDEALAGYYQLRFNLLLLSIILLLLFASTVLFTLTLASRAGQAMRRSRGELENMVDKRTNELKRSKQKLLKSHQQEVASNKALEESQFLFTSMASNIPGVIYRCLLDKHWTMLYISDEVFRMTGYQASDYLTNIQTFIKTMHPDDTDRVAEQIQNKIKNKEKFVVDYRVINRTGEVKWVRDQGQAVYSDDGSVGWLDGAIFDISDVKAAEKLTTEAIKRAELANKSKSDFLANMSHEIRTPMNAILGFTGLLSEQVQEPRLQSFIKTIQSAGNNLMLLINDILDLSRIEAGKFEIQKINCNPVELLHELADIFRLKVAEKNIDLILDIDPLIPESLLLDKIRLRQVLLNLIGNAIKFTEKGFIRVQLQAENKDEIRSKLDLLISVEDSGIGISEEQQQLIFEEFTQSSGQDARKYGGTGLGLSIGKRLVEMMGGTISLSSQPEKGSTFSIKLLDVDVAALNVPEVVEEINDAQSTVIIFSPATILIVDDIADNRALLLANFADTPLKTLVAKNGLEAVDCIKQQHVDLVLMDIRMPIMSGYEAAEEIKKFSSVPIVALTASVMTNAFEPINTDDFNGYLRKPVLKADLMHELSKFLPFKEVPIPENHANKKITLTDAEYKILPNVLSKLESLSDVHKTIAEGNNLAEIQQFAEDILKINKDYPIQLVERFAQQLIDQIATFDISAIKCSINHYPELIELLIKQK